MKKSFAMLLTMILVVASFSACGAPKKQEEKKAETTNVTATAENKEVKKVKVVGSILPQREWIQAVTGDLAEINILIPPGKSPEMYQATPKEMIALEEADIYFSISVPVETEGIIPNTGTKAKVVNLATAAAQKYPDLFFEDDHDHEHEHEHEHKDEKSHDHDKDHDHAKDKEHEHADEHKDEKNHDHDKDHDHAKDKEHEHADEHKDGKEHDHDHDHHHTGRDPHIWLSPRRVAVMVETIRDTMAEVDPANAEIYKKNAQEYLEKLAAKDKEIADVLSKVSFKNFIIMHPAMGYFADDYGLHQISIEKEGKQATAEHLKKVIDIAKEHDIKVIFYQKEFDNNQAKTIAGEIGGEVRELIPLNPNYLENLDILKEAFSAILK